MKCFDSRLIAIANEENVYSITFSRPGQKDDIENSMKICENMKGNFTNSSAVQRHKFKGCLTLSAVWDFQ